MAEHFPGFEYRVSRGGGLTWEGELRPTPDSNGYRVRIEHERRRAPRVHVVAPELPSVAPHRYDDGSLCLYWPEEWSWRDGEELAATIVPWAALWFYYFEAWQVTGEWFGPEAQHQGPKRRQG